MLSALVVAYVVHLKFQFVKFILKLAKKVDEKVFIRIFDFRFFFIFVFGYKSRSYQSKMINASKKCSGTIMSGVHTGSKKINPGSLFCVIE